MISFTVKYLGFVVHSFKYIKFKYINFKRICKSIFQLDWNCGSYMYSANTQ